MKQKLQEFEQNLIDIHVSTVTETDMIRSSEMYMLFSK